MDSRFFESRLQNHKLFKEIKEGLKENSDTLRNLVELKDEVLYFWHTAENCLLTLNLKLLEDEEKETPFQRLNFLSPPSFGVQRVLAGACGTRVCVWGPRGAVIAELPSRWGRSGLFDGGKESVLCKSYALDERLLYSHGDVRRVQWHPTSLSHVLVLVSDNTIRVYNIALKHGPKLVKILNIGAKPTGLISGKTLQDSLGETAVDFTALTDTTELLILRGNGDVYMIDCDLDTRSPLPPSLQGPLTMYPPADDNYGVESCSIAVIDGATEPATVVIATCSAILYHCLLLPETASESKETSNKTESEYALYVVEAVDLNISLNQEDDNLQYTYPVHLYPCSSTTYVCVHAAGVHTVSLPLVTQLKEYMTTEEETDSSLAWIFSRSSVARYSVCTRASGSECLAPAAVAVCPPPSCGVVVVCCDGRVIYRWIEPYDLEDLLYREMQMKNPALEQDDLSAILKERQRLPFTSIVEEMLTRGVSQPLLNVNKEHEPSAKEALEFASQATLKLRQEYISRQRRVADVIQKKVNSLRTLRGQQGDWHDELKKEIDDAIMESRVIREKCDLAQRKQDDLNHRCYTIIRSLRVNASSTPAERELIEELEKFNNIKDKLEEHVDLLKVRVKEREREMKKWQEDYKKKDIALGKSHSDTISSVLQQQTAQISSLIEETKLLKDQLSIV